MRTQLAGLANAALEDVAYAQFAERRRRHSTDWLLKVNAVFRAVTANAETFDRSVVMSSLIPSLKYSCSASPLMLGERKHAHPNAAAVRSTRRTDFCGAPASSLQAAKQLTSIPWRPSNPRSTRKGRRTGFD